MYRNQVSPSMNFTDVWEALHVKRDATKQVCGIKKKNKSIITSGTVCSCFRFLYGSKHCRVSQEEMFLTIPKVLIFCFLLLLSLGQKTFFHLFVFSKHFIFVRDVVDPESILGTLCTKHKLQP